MGTTSQVQPHPPRPQAEPIYIYIGMARYRLEGDAASMQEIRSFKESDKSHFLRCARQTALFAIAQTSLAENATSWKPSRFTKIAFTPDQMTCGSDEEEVSYTGKDLKYLTEIDVPAAPSTDPSAPPPAPQKQKQYAKEQLAKIHQLFGEKIVQKFGQELRAEYQPDTKALDVANFPQTGEDLLEHLFTLLPGYRSVRKAASSTAPTNAPSTTSPIQPQDNNTAAQNASSNRPLPVDQGAENNTQAAKAVERSLDLDVVSESEEEEIGSFAGKNDGLADALSQVDQDRNVSLTAEQLAFLQEND